MNESARAPDPTPAQPAPSGPRPSLLRLLFVIVGGWIVTTIAGSLLISESAGAAEVAMRGLLSLLWYAAIAFEGHAWWKARRPKVAGAPRTGPSKATTRLPIVGMISVACPVMVWALVNHVFFGDFKGPTGESALIGFFAITLLAVLGIVVGIASGVASIVTKEPRWLGLIGITGSAGTAIALAMLIEAGSL